MKSKQAKLELERENEPIEDGYARVRFERLIDFRFYGSDLELYGPFKWRDEATIPIKQARTLEKRNYLTIKRMGRDVEDGKE